MIYGGCFLIILVPFTLITLVGAIGIAYSRKIASPHRILLTAVFLPSAAIGTFVAGVILLHKLHSSGISLGILLVLTLVSYMAACVGLLFYAKVQVVVEQRGFPIEPTNSVAANDSHPV